MTAQFFLSLIFFLFLIQASLDLQAQVEIALQNFENSGSTYNYTNTNGSLQTGNSNTTDRPASANFYSSSNTAFRVTNQTATLLFDNMTGLATYHSKKIKLRAAAFSINSPSNGLDNGDKMIISVSLDGGATFSNELIVKGNSNAYWHYTSGTGTATATYDGNNVATEFNPAGGGNRTTDGYSNLILKLPDSCTQVKLKIVLNNDSNNEAWLLDHVQLTGCTPLAVTCPEDSTVCLDSGLIPLAGGHPSGGIYSGPGVSGGMFDPESAGVGIHVITYTYTDINDCKGSCTFQISVNANRVHNVQSDMDYCSLLDAIVDATDGDELEIPNGVYLGSCINLNKNLTLTPLISGIEIPCLEMTGIGKYLILGDDLIITHLTLANGKIRTNGYQLICESIDGGSPSSYIITD